MRQGDPYYRLLTLLLLVATSACVQPIEFKTRTSGVQLVVEGVITDGPGPYTVYISESLPLGERFSGRSPVSEAVVTLFDDRGNSETLVEKTEGEYESSGIIRGQVGHSYHLRIITSDQRIFESRPDTLRSIGAVENIRYEFEARTTEESFGEVAADVFNIFVDANSGGMTKYVRLRYTGIYQVNAAPELKMTRYSVYTPYKDPPPCSGYKVVPGPTGSGGLLEQFGECTCCECWVYEYEKKPVVFDDQLVTGNQFNNIKMGEVPISRITFSQKFLILIEEMSLNKEAFDFFKSLSGQKENAEGLFQTPAGTIRGNIEGINNDDAVVGLFYATSISSKSIYLDKSHLPYALPPMQTVADDCREYFNGTNVKPQVWNE